MSDLDDVLQEIARHPGLYGAIGPRVLAGVGALRKELLLQNEANNMIGRERDAWSLRAARAEDERDALQPLLNALRHIDWIQIILNQSAPCCFIEDGRFCGRAERWAGHEHFHKFISLNDAIDTPRRP